MHDGLHEHSESTIIEIVDADGKRVPDGTFGRILLTDLLNYNMPFVRYEIGDSGRLVHERCACGLETPRLYLEGRYSAHLTFGDRRVQHLEFDGALDGLMNVILQYRVVKESDTSLAVQVVPGPRFTADTAADIEARMHALVPGVAAHVDMVESLPRTPRGKSQIVADLSSETVSE
jgi:phenylacetate-CoA ligase